MNLYNIKVKEVETLTKQAAEQVVKLNKAVNSKDPNAGHFIDGARAKLTDLDEQIKAAKSDLVDLETMLVADSFALSTPPPSATGGDDVDTEEVTRQKKIKSSLEDLSKANRILALDKMGLNEAEKEFQILQIELGRLTPIQEKQLRTLTREQVQMNKAYDAATKANDAYNTKMKEGQTIAQGFIPEQTKLEQQLRHVDAVLSQLAPQLAQRRDVVERAVEVTRHITPRCRLFVGLLLQLHQVDEVGAPGDEPPAGGDRIRDAVRARIVERLHAATSSRSPDPSGSPLGRHRPLRNSGLQPGVSQSEYNFASGFQNTSKMELFGVRLKM